MTYDEKLAAIEAQLAMRMLGEIMPIAEVRRLQGEYARGRAEERKDVAAWLTSDFAAHDIVELIERGEHVAEVKDAT